MRVILASVMSLIVATPAYCQDDRLEKPQTPDEWWRAVNFELNTGKYDSAAYYLKGMLAANPTDQDLLDIEAKQGMAGFLRLRNIATWSTDAKVHEEARKNAEDLIKRVNDALEKHLGDPQRIAKYIRNLRGSDEERIFAIRELQRAGMRALPGIAAVLRADPDPAARAAVLNVIPLLPEESVTPLLASFDMADAHLKYQLLTSLGMRADFPYLPGRTETNPLPTLDYLAASPKETPEVRKLARDLIVKLRPIGKSEIRPAKQELVEAAWRYYRHQERFVKPEAMPVWRWENDQLVLTPSNTSQSEEYYGLRFARWALELDPEYLPAQVVFITIALDKAMERAGLEAGLANIAPEVHDFLATANATSLIAALDQALIEQRTPVVLGLTRVLGDRAELRAAQSTKNRPSALQRALEYPDRRVQMAAAEALVRLPNGAGQQHQTKITEVLRRSLAAETELNAPSGRRAIIGAFDPVFGRAIGDVFKAAGFDVIYARTGREVLRRLREANDIDAVVVDAEIPDQALPDLLASLRHDIQLSSLPVRVIHSPIPASELPSARMEARLGRSTPQTTIIRNGEIVQNAQESDRVRRLTQGMRGVAVLPGTLTPALVQASFAQDSSNQEAPLTDAERKRFAMKAIELLRVMAVNGGYDLKPADHTIRQALKNNELAKPALDIVARLPGRDAQNDLANVVLDGTRPPEHRLAATEALIQHIQRFGSVLTNDSVSALTKLAAQEKAAEIRGRVADVVGAINLGSKTTGERIRMYFPPKPGVPQPLAEKPAAEPEKKPDANPDDK